MVRVVFILSVLLFPGCKSKEKINADNLKKIKTGMTVEQVKSIMGTPDTTCVAWGDTARFSFMYHAPLLFSDNFYIYFSNKDSIVVGINNGL